MSLGTAAGKLRALGVETVGVVATAADPVRRYFTYRPPRYLVAADPDLVSHRAFGVPATAYAGIIVDVVTARNDDLAREIGLAAPAGSGREALDRHDGLAPGEFMPDLDRHQGQLTAQFLVDRDGVIRWTNVECERDGLDGIDRFPTDAELLAVAHALGEVGPGSNG